MNDEEKINLIKDFLNNQVHNDDESIYYEVLTGLNDKLFNKSERKYGTPQYFINLDQLKLRTKNFKNTFLKYLPRSEIFYAFKCNDLPILIKTLKDNDYNADVAGLFELELALKMKFNKIIFTGPGKSIEEIELALKNSNNVIINLDSIHELQVLKGIIKKRKIKNKVKLSIRLNLQNKENQEWSKFGIKLDNLSEMIFEINKEKKLLLCGLHFHASWNRNPSKYLKNIEILGTYLKENPDIMDFSNLEFIDIGGGFYPEGIAVLTKFTPKGEIYKILKEETNLTQDELGFDLHNFFIRPVEPLENFAKSISEHLKKYIFPLNPDLKIYLEPGRYIATHSTSIILKVISEKDNCVIVDGGINLVGDYRFEEFSFAPIINLSRPSTTLRKKIIYGPLCDPSDIWGFSYFGQDIKVGDTLVILHQGAYSFSCNWHFIKPVAQYIASSGKKLILAKRTETFKDKYKGCVL